MDQDEITAEVYIEEKYDENEGDNILYSMDHDIMSGLTFSQYNKSCMKGNLTCPSMLQNAIFRRESLPHITMHPFKLSGQQIWGFIVRIRYVLCSYSCKSQTCCVSSRLIFLLVCCQPKLRSHDVASLSKILQKLCVQSQNRY